MGSHSVTCHPAEVRIPPLPPNEAGSRFRDPGRMQGWVDLCYVKEDRLGIEPAATCQSQVQRPTAAPPRRRRTGINGSVMFLSLEIGWRLKKVRVGDWFQCLASMLWVSFSASKLLVECLEEHAVQPVESLRQLYGTDSLSNKWRKTIKGTFGERRFNRRMAF